MTKSRAVTNVIVEAVLSLGGRGSIVCCAALVDDHPSLRNVWQIARARSRASELNLNLGHIDTQVLPTTMRAHSLAETELQ